MNETNIESAVQHIMQAKEIMRNKQIEANTIILNKSFAYSNGLLVDNIKYPAFICGLKIKYTNEKLPLDSNFIVLRQEEYENDNKNNYGFWISTGFYDSHMNPIYQCSNCKKEVADYFIGDHKYCLHCGAEMKDVL